MRRHDDDVLRHLRPHDLQALVLEQVPSEHRVNPDTGVWLLRSCPQSLAFLDAGERAGQRPGPCSRTTASDHGRCPAPDVS